jgi:hypothetical protein
MKTKYLIGKLIVLIALLVLSCKKEGIESPEFDVTAEKSTFKVGDTATFNMQGDPDNVYFYSGEYLNEYAYANGRSLEIKSFNASFQSRVANGNQANQLSVFVSNDFNGKFDIASIKAGNFIDITNKFTLGSVNAVYAGSGAVDLSPYVNDKTKPVYFAFRYSVKPQTPANGTVRTWTIRDFAFNTITDQGPRVAADQLTAAWTLVEAGAILDPGRSSINTSSGQLTLRGNASAEGKLLDTEHWAVSKAISLNTINLGPDRSIPIKSLAETLPSVYKYIYTKPGTYKATFVTSNERIDGKKTALKEITITVTP